MNRDCHGDYFPSLNKYLCFANGEFVDVPDHPYLCPACERVVVATVYHNATVREYKVREIHIDLGGGTWVEMDREIISSTESTTTTGGESHE